LREEIGAPVCGMREICWQVAGETFVDEGREIFVDCEVEQL